MRRFLKNNYGLAAIEFAIVLPILILIIFAVIEFGIYFVKSQIASRSVTNSSYSILQNPSNANIQSTAKQSGLSILDLETLPNFICAKSYATNNAAKAGLCSAGEWDTSVPSGLNSDDAYFVVVRAFAAHLSLTPLRAISGTLPPDIDEKTIIQVGQSTYSQKTCKAILVNDISGYTWHDSIMVPSNFTPTDCWNYVFQIFDMYKHLEGQRVYYSLGCVFDTVQSNGIKTSTTGPIQFLNGNLVPSPNCGW